MSDITAQKRLLCGLLFIAFVLRAGVVWRHADHLRIDRDAYLAIAERIADGDGFCAHPGHPTAFRPPVYPLLLAACRAANPPFDWHLLIGIMQAGLGTATVLLTVLLARRIGLTELRSLLAGAVVAFDPLLLQYTSEAMTETIFTALMTLFLLMERRLQYASHPRSSLLAGLLLGLTSLCRPTVWPFAAMMAGTTIFRRWMKRDADDIRWNLRTVSFFLFGVLLSVAPWLIRNASVFGKPILTTTHGGYTLVLGNNDVFLREVVDQSGHPAWTEASLLRWQRELASRIGDDWNDERKADQRLKAEGWSWIKSHPTGFLRCALFRQTRLWAIGPGTETSLPDSAVLLVRIWFGAILSAAFAGLCLNRDLRMKWQAGPLLVLSLSLLHGVYWADTRMRAPAVPVLGVLAAAVPLSCGNSRRNAGIAHRTEG